MATPLRRRTDQQSGGGAPLRALVVDDHEAYRDYAASLVSRFGFSVISCANGNEALEIVRQGTSFDLLIADFGSPGLTGLELIKAMRAHELHHDVYAMMLTARESVETKIEALGMGFDDFMVKSATELEIGAHLSAARRVIVRQRRLDDAVRELYGLATRDELTGLFNRRYFFHEADHLLSEDRTINLIFFDLDHFKQINDTLGHLAGDRILRDIGALFLNRTRTEDLIARYGGDEFVMLVPNLSPAEVEILAHRIGEEIQRVQWIFGTDVFNVGVTTGIACSSLLDKPTVPQLLAAGDRDLYKNKWLRTHPDEDPSVYEYDKQRDAHVIEIVIPELGDQSKKA